MRSLFLVAALLVGGWSGAQPDLAPRALESDELDADTVRRIALRFEVDRLAFAAMERSGVPGLVIAVAFDGDVIAEEAYGSADISGARSLTLDDPLWLASLTEVLTAIVTLDLIAEGVLDLDDPLQRALPGVDVPPDPSGSDRPITLRHLLAHTAGFDERRFGTVLEPGTENPPLRDLLDDGLPPRVHAVGERLLDCTICSALLGMVIEEATGAPIDEVFRERLFGPLALASGRLLTPAEPAYEEATARPHGRTSGGIDALSMPTLADPTAGQARLSGVDVGRLLAALTAAEPPEPLARGVRTALLSTAFRAAPEAPGSTLGMAEGQVLGHEVVRHTGDLPGAHSVVAIVPDAALAIFVHVNGESDPEAPVATADGWHDVRWSVVEGLVELLLGDARRPATAVRTLGSGDDAHESTGPVAGTYRVDGFARGTAERFFGPALVPVTLVVEEDGAVVLNPPTSLSSARRYLPAGDGSHRRDVGGDSLAFTRDARGEPLVHVDIGAPLTLERVPPLERVEVLVGTVVAFALIAGAVLLSSLTGSVRARRRRGPRGDDPPGPVRAVRWAGRGVAVAGLATLGLVGGAIAQSQSAPAAAPPLLGAAAAGFGLTLVATIVLAAYTLLGATSGDGRRRTWIFHVVVTVAAVALLVQGSIWNLTPWS
ncbi:MAG: beta-lactamase family protein [Trueperaceae bacterium]|nr:beta-lactamase family protein [Trueperaceae bacterium]